MQILASLATVLVLGAITALPDIVDVSFSNQIGGTVEASSFCVHDIPDGCEFGQEYSSSDSFGGTITSFGPFSYSGTASSPPPVGGLSGFVTISGELDQTAETTASTLSLVVQGTVNGDGFGATTFSSAHFTDQLSMTFTLTAPAVISASGFDWLSVIGSNDQGVFFPPNLDDGTLEPATYQVEGMSDHLSSYYPYGPFDSPFSDSYGLSFEVTSAVPEPVPVSVVPVLLIAAIAFVARLRKPACLRDRSRGL